MNDKTYTARQGDIERSWFVVDAAGETLGRLATRVARVLEGKHKPTWSPNLDGGDRLNFVIAGHSFVEGPRRKSAVKWVKMVLARASNGAGQRDGGRD